VLYLCGKLDMSQKDKTRDTVIIYCPGFLSTDDSACVYHGDAPKGTRIIGVDPSSVCSIHDRVMQIFYSIKGGTVRYGHQHSAFHGHNEKGRVFEEGLYSEWDESHPVHLIGHSFGGVTVRALAAYLAKGTEFHGYKTSPAWCTSVNTFSSPLNGGLRVYSLGADIGMAPVVRWGSPGCIVGWLVHVLGFLGKGRFLQVEHWQLERNNPHAVVKLFEALVGFAVHSTTDNSAYDMTIHSQQQWSKVLELRDDTYYSNVVSTTYSNAPLSTQIVYQCMELFLRDVPRKVLGIDTSKWMSKGYDGLLSVTTQEGCFLSEQRCDVIKPSLARGVEKGASTKPNRGELYTTMIESDHVGYSTEAWNIMLSTIAAFEEFSNNTRGACDGSQQKASPRETRNCIDEDECKAPAHGGTLLLPDRPDLQAPLWSVSNRMFMNPPSVFGSVAIGETLYLLLIISISVLTFTVKTHAELQASIVFYAVCASCILVPAAIFAPCTDIPESVSALLRMLVPAITSYFDTPPGSAVSLYAALLIEDAALSVSLCRSKRRDNTLPLIKVLLALMLSSERESMKLWVAICSYDMSVLLCKFSWIAYSSALKRSHKMELSAVWLLETTCMGVNISLSGSGQVFGGVLGFVFVKFIYIYAFLCRTRDLSEAFQVHAIQLKYK